MLQSSSKEKKESPYANVPPEVGLNRKDLAKAKKQSQKQGIEDNTFHILTTQGVNENEKRDSARRPSPEEQQRSMVSRSPIVQLGRPPSSSKEYRRKVIEVKMLTLG